MSTIDAYHSARILVDNAFSHLTWYDEVCTRTGFKGISQIWREDPAWYFWTEQLDGAFLLRLHADEPLQDDHLLNFSLHYFPAPTEELYQSLSAGEKWLISDEASFDLKTNTPQFEAYNQFVSMFVTAEIGCVVDDENRLKLLFFSSVQEADHPVYCFLDLLVTALNFQGKTHQSQMFEMEESEFKTLILSYSDAVFNRFLSEFGLNESHLRDVSRNERADQWKHAAHMDAVCSLSGACSCSHSH